MVDYVGLEELPNFISSIEKLTRIPNPHLQPPKEKNMPFLAYDYETSDEIYSRVVYAEQISTNNQHSKPWFVQTALCS